MITQDSFYNHGVAPSGRAKKKMWRQIAKHLPAHRRPLFGILDVRSFAYGIAASVLLYFAGLGIAASISRLAARTESPTMKMENAYRTAIGELERILPLVTYAGSKTQPGVLSEKQKQLAFLDNAINDLNTDIRTNGLSSVKNDRLRALYNMKLEVLQSMINTGEIEL